MASFPDQERERSGRGMGSRLSGALTEFLATEVAGGVFLFLAAATALVWASTAFPSYRTVWTDQLPGHLGRAGLPESLRGLINSGLMTVFFFIVGLEIKRELVSGELRNRRAAALPVIAALGGMLVPALIYVLMAGAGARHGWGIPMATDIAFSLGVLTLFGRGLPQGLRVLLLTIAVADDIGTLIVISIFYAGSIRWVFLIAAIALLLVMRSLAHRHIGWLPLYILLGAILWWLTLQSGVPPTIAGVALGLLIPAGLAGVERIEHQIHPWSSYGILPLFALANAGLPLVLGDIARAAGSKVVLAILVGRIGGKLVGITLGALLAVRLGVGMLPEEVSWGHVVAVGSVASVGFTVPLFVTTLAFDTPGLIDHAKLGILLATLVGFVIGAMALHIAARGARPVAA